MYKIFLIALVWLALPALADTTQPAGTSLADKARSLAVLADSAQAQGVFMPEGLYPAVCRALSANDNDSAAELSGFDQALGNYRDILNLLMATPALAGTARILPGRGAMVAGGTVSIAQTWTPGEALGPGAAILVALHWMDPWGLQANDASAPDYVSVDAGSVKFTASTVDRQGVFGGRYADAPMPVFELQGNLAAGQTVTVHYRKLRLPGRAAARFPLPLYVRLTAGGPFIPVPPGSIAIGAAPLARLAVFAPAIVKTGAAFSVSIKMTDRFGDPATGDLPPLDVLVDGTVRTRVAAGTDPSPNITLTLAAGTHQISVSSAGGGLSGSAAVQAEDNPPYQVRWVDLHIHSNLSDALQSPAEIQDRLSGTLDDFFVIDHDNEMTGADWLHRPQQALDGFEWSAGLRSGGHYLVLSSTPFTLQASPRLEYPHLADLVTGIRGPDKLMVALPEIPGDARLVDPAVTRLVEIKAGSGTFEWLGNRFAQRGYRVGFTGSSTAHNHQMGPPSSTGRTAVMVLPGESLFDALRARRTWVTSGPRIFVAVRVNGSVPGSRAAAATVRDIEGHVIGTAGIARVDLIRDGKLIASKDFTADTTASTVKVSFYSSSAPVAGDDDLPRNGREWIGFVKADGATMSAVDGSAFHNPVRQAVAINPGDSSRVDFITWTRGQPSSFTFDVAGATGETMLDMSLKSGHEDNDEIPRDRAPAVIPALRLAIPWTALQHGVVTRQYDVDGYSDRVTFELVKKQVPATQDFKFTDDRPWRQGDYYYVRVTQVDDGMAWSSPVWVGGFDAH